MIGFVRAIVVFDVVVFFLAALSHLGVPIPLGVAVLEEPVILPAAVVEGLVALFFAVAAYGLFARAPWAWRAAIGAHVFAIAGVLVGMAALTVGAGPRTEANDFYHRVMLLVLVAGVIYLWRPQAREALP